MTNVQPRTLVILGAASAVAIAFARQACAAGSVRVFLLGRDEQRLSEVLADLVARGAASGSGLLAGNIGDPAAVDAMFGALMERCGQIDDALLAYGMLGDQKAQQSDTAVVRELMDVNLVSAAMWCEAVAAEFEKQGHGRLAVIGSVAGDRGRQSNYLYGATKAALERICEGMAHRFAARREITITLVKPGFIDTPMTANIKKGGPLWASADAVAAIIHRAMKAGRVRVYAPWFWRYILLIVRSLPVPVMHKTKM